jgi:site-specific DNA-methyltransferase (adenine-specific)
MGKKWDTYSNFYEWNKQRAEGLYRIVKHGGYVMIFGHHKTNHRMKCAFEDAGFKIVEEIDWCYASGFPKNQDIGKLFDKDAKVVRQGTGEFKTRHGGGAKSDKISQLNPDWKETEITLPTSALAKQWDGWKTSGLKPAKEIITVFQKPLKGKYIDNIKEYGCGAMNIDACRIPISQEDIEMLNKKASKNPTTNYGDSENKIYGKYAEDKAMPPNELGRFPSNIIFDTYMGQVLDNQNTDASKFYLNVAQEEYAPFLYCAKPTKKEKGENCKHVTVKPKKLIKWLIKLVTPINGKSLDITAGSGTHGLSCEELNKEEGYNLEWVNIEMMNTEDEPYFDIAKQRISESIR